MSTNTRLKKTSEAGAGKFSYKYTELADINAYLDARGEAYYQYTEWDDGSKSDYIFTVIIHKDGKESNPRRGVKIISGGAGNNLAQQQGSGVTYARRYSLLMALGLATEDDDGASAGGNVQPKMGKPKYQQKPNESFTLASDKQIGFLKRLLEELGKDEETIANAIKQANGESSKVVSGWIQSYQRALEEQKKGGVDVSA